VTLLLFVILPTSFCKYGIIRFKYKYLSFLLYINNANPKYLLSFFNIPQKQLSKYGSDPSVFYCKSNVNPIFWACFSCIECLDVLIIGKCRLVLSLPSRLFKTGRLAVVDSFSITVLLSISIKILLCLFMFVLTRFVVVVLQVVVFILLCVCIEQHIQIENVNSIRNRSGFYTSSLSRFTSGCIVSQSLKQNKTHN
jgi:hypothetical protein